MPLMPQIREIRGGGERRSGERGREGGGGCDFDRSGGHAVRPRSARCCAAFFLSFLPCFPPACLPAFLMDLTALFHGQEERGRDRDCARSVLAQGRKEAESVFVLFWRRREMHPFPSFATPSEPRGCCVRVQAPLVVTCACVMLRLRRRRRTGQSAPCP